MIGKHFSEEDFSCSCCGLHIVDEKLLKMLDDLETYLTIWFEKDCTILIKSEGAGHCTVRCEKQNKKIGGVDNSRHLPKFHLIGEGACDMHVKEISIKELHNITKKLWDGNEILTGGLGFYGWGVHIDGSSKRFWEG